MPKKIYDIIPPERKEKSSFKELVILSKKDKTEKPVIPTRKKRKLLGFSVKIIAVAIFLLAGFFAVDFFFFNKVKIDIWPVADSLNLVKSAVVDVYKEADYQNGVIPGEIFENERKESKEFPASGKAVVEEKARGIIKVYNGYSQSPQSLVIGTRFVSADGKLFKSVKKETVPGGSYDKGKFVPGEIDIEVIAAEAGESYNIGPSTFSIPGFAGTPKYTSFYGKSFSDIKGGFEGEVSQIVQADLDKAEEDMVNRLKQEAGDMIKKSIPEGYVLLNEAIFQKTAEKNFSKKAGETGESFSLEVKIVSKAIIFKKADMEKAAEYLVKSKMQEGWKIKGMEISYAFKSIGYEEEDESSISLDADIKSVVYEDIDLEDIKKSIYGKSFNEVRSFLTGYKGVSKVKIEPGAFWKNRMPEDINKIEIGLKLQ